MINRTKKYLYIFYSILAYLVPMAVLVGVKHKTYFKTPAMGLTIFGTIVLIIALLTLSRKITKLKLLPLIFGHIVVIAAMELPILIAKEVELAICVSLVGIIVSWYFDNVADYYRRTSYNPDGTLNMTPIPDKQAWKEAYCFGIVRSKKE